MNRVIPANPILKLAEAGVWDSGSNTKKKKNIKAAFKRAGHLKCKVHTQTRKQN